MPKLLILLIFFLFVTNFFVIVRYRFKKYRLFTYVLLVIFLIVTGGALGRLNMMMFSQKTSTLDIYNKEFIMSSRNKEFKLDPPLKRTLNSACVLLKIESDWQPIPPWNKIKLPSGKVVKINITLITTNGKKIHASILGSGAGGMMARFKPEINIDDEINKIKLSSDVPLQCDGVYWYNYNPL